MRSESRRDGRRSPGATTVRAQEKETSPSRTFPRLSTTAKKKISAYKDKVLLIVNTASKCGFTGQYEGLQKLYGRIPRSGLRGSGLSMRSVRPSEPGSDADIKSFCDMNYGVEFPLFSKIDVNGTNEWPSAVQVFKRREGRSARRFHQVELHQSFSSTRTAMFFSVVERYAPTTPPERASRLTLKNCWPGRNMSVSS